MYSCCSRCTSWSCFCCQWYSGYNRCSICCSGWNVVKVGVIFVDDIIVGVASVVNDDIIVGVVGIVGVVVVIGVVIGVVFIVNDDVVLL